MKRVYRAQRVLELLALPLFLAAVAMQSVYGSTGWTPQWGAAVAVLVGYLALYWHVSGLVEDHTAEQERRADEEIRCRRRREAEWLRAR
jgi:hypothetical protein